MRYYIVDVFAEQKYQGNQLAVFLPDRALATAEMQAIAQEVNFSETAFVTSGLQPDGGYAVRIFTPDVELPFAGHPTLGTAFVIQRVLDQGRTRIALNLPVGQIAVTFGDPASNLLFMRQREPIFGQTFDQATIAGLLQIDADEIRPDFPIQLVSTGLPAIMVPLRTRQSVERCAIHHERFGRFLAETARANLLVFAADPIHAENDLHVRVFVNDFGFYEDPATGSANGNLAGYLLEHNVFPDSRLSLRVEQGYQIRRPSLIQIEAEKKDGTYQIEVGGKVFLIARGEWL